MVHIRQNKIFIEIDCYDRNAFDFLDDFQKSLLKVIAISKPSDKLTHENTHTQISILKTKKCIADLKREQKERQQNNMHSRAKVIRLNPSWSKSNQTFK